MAVQEGEACLSIPPSWPGVPRSDNFWYFLDYQALTLHLNYLISPQTTEKPFQVCIFNIHLKIWHRKELVMYLVFTTRAFVSNVVFIDFLSWNGNEFLAHEALHFIWKIY